MALNILNTKYGKVQGVVEEGVLVFKGIRPACGRIALEAPGRPGALGRCAVV